MTEIIELPDYPSYSTADMLETQQGKGIASYKTPITVFENGRYKQSSGPGTPQIIQRIEPMAWTPVECPPAYRITEDWQWDAARGLWKVPEPYGFWHTIYVVCWAPEDVDGNALVKHRRKNQEYAENGDNFNVAAGENEVIFNPAALGAETGQLRHTFHQSYMQPGHDPGIAPHWDGIRVWHNNPVAQNLVGFQGLAPLVDTRRASAYDY